MSNEDFTSKAEYHDGEARRANEIRRKFETGDYFGSSERATDHDNWVKEMIELHSRLEANHIALRDGYRRKAEP